MSYTIDYLGSAVVFHLLVCTLHGYSANYFVHCEMLDQIVGLLEVL